MTTTQPSLEPTVPRKVPIERVRTPWWRRLTALISLGSLVVVTGMILAAVAAASVLLLLMFLERAAG